MALTLEQALADFSPGLPFAVALSGGADSTALLLASTQRWPGQVRAVHIHHGLQDAADAFEAHCRDLCQQLNVPLAVRRVQAGHASGQSPEDAARKARYAALAEAVQSEWPDVHDIALAQHADDQVETLLIALSRGAGLPGLASMPAHWTRLDLNWHRPCLALPGAALREWLKEQGPAQGQSWVDDPSNSDERFTRNRIRAKVLPALAEALPAFRETFARSAAHAAQAQEVLNEVAAHDLEKIGVPPRIQALQQLSRARQALVLRHWLRQHHATTPSTAQLHELLDQVAACTTRGHRLHLKVGQGFVEREALHLAWKGQESVRSMGTI